MKVKDLMSPNVTVVHMDNNVGQIKQIFDNHHFHHVLVVEDSKLIGVISDRDVLRALHPKVGFSAASEKDLACLKKRAHQLMSRKLITLPMNADVYSAIDVFNQHRVSCIPIVDDESHPVGILSWRDILKSIERPA